MSFRSRIILAVMVGLLAAGSCFAFELPRLTDLALVSPATVSTGGVITLRYRFAAGSAPTNAVYFDLAGPGGTLRQFAGDSLQGTVSLPVGADWVSGSYVLSAASATTMYNRVIAFSADGSTSTPRNEVAAGTTPRLDAIKVNVIAAILTYRPPVVASLSRTGGATLTPADQAVISNTLVPGTSALTTLRMRFRGPGPKTTTISLPTGPAGTAILAPAADWWNGTYTALDLSAFDAAGVITIYDRSGTISSNGTAAGTHALNLPALDFTVAGAKAAPDFPRLSDVVLNSSNQLRGGDDAIFRFSVIPGSSAVQQFTIEFVSSRSVSDTLIASAVQTVLGSITLTVPPDLSDSASVTYLAQNVTLTDSQGNTVTYARSGDLQFSRGGTRSSHTFDLSRLDFSVSPPLAGRLTNLGVRSPAGSDSQTLITGFAIGGAGTTGAKSLLVRAVGPTLRDFGVTNPLEDPVLAIFSGSAKLLENDDWQGDATIAATGSAVGAFPFSKTSSADAATIFSVSAAGTFSAQIAGKNSATGVVLAEIYDTTPGGAFSATTRRLTNLSARSQVGLGADVLIGSFVIAGGPKTVLIRAIGPSLTPYGVQGVLRNPQLTLYSSRGEKLAANDDWSGDPALADAFGAVGAFTLAADSTDAALVVTLPAGAYTAQVSGVATTTGVALVEVYELR